MAQVVLFPQTLSPLHVFEPRYRKLLADALLGDRLIGMALVRTGDLGGNPAVYPIGCAGRVVRHEPLADGRSLIVLRGLLRYRIRGEVDDGKPYRIAEIQALHDAPIPAENMRPWRSDLRGLVSDYLRAADAEAATLEELFAKSDLERIVNTLSLSLPLEVLEKQSLLDCSTAEQRYRRLSEILRFKTLEARLGMATSRDADA